MRMPVMQVRQVRMGVHERDVYMRV